MLRVALRVPEDELEQVLDRLLPLIPAGVHQRDVGDNVVELATYGIPGHMPTTAALVEAAGDALIGEPEEQEVPADWRARRRMFGRGHLIGGRIMLRSDNDPPPGDESIVDVVIHRSEGAFGSGAHPTTRATLELMLEVEPGGAFADLGCGAGTLAIAAAKLGWQPVLAVDYEPGAVDATRDNAERNRVHVEAFHMDLMEVEPPPARTVAANVPPAVHRKLAPALAPEVEQVVLSGVVDEDSEQILAVYADAGFTLRKRVAEGGGWATVLLERGG